jgi:NitT/TauT family transport system substrate-binding protein
LDQADPIVILAGVHIGCFELFGTERVRAIRDLKGKTVAVPDLQTGPITFLASMVAYVGLDPRKDITWVTHPRAEAKQLLAEGKIDAFLGFPPDPQELRAKKIGHVVVNSAVDQPWSHYFCCLLAGNREFVRTHPVATKRAVRAILKAADVCALEPERVARFLVDKGYTPHYDYALQTMQEVPYDKWREYDPEDTVRFYALRLHEAGMIKSSPQKILAQGTDWRFFNELTKELKR